MGNTIDGTSNANGNYKLEEPKTEAPPKEAPSRSVTEKVAAWSEAASDCAPMFVPWGAGTLATFVKEQQKTGSLTEAAVITATKTALDTSSEAALHEMGTPGLAVAVGLKYATCYDSVKEAVTGKIDIPTAQKVTSGAAPLATGDASKKASDAALEVGGNAVKKGASSSSSETEKTTGAAGDAVTKKVAAGTTSAALSILDAALSKLTKRP